MIEILRQFQSLAITISKKVRSTKSRQVSSRETKEMVKNLVDYYFRSVRALFNDAQSADSTLKGCDVIMQLLLEASHVNSAVSTYKKILKDLDKELIALEKYALLVVNNQHVFPRYDQIDIQIIETLNNLLPSAAKSYEQSLIDLSMTSRMSWRGPATDLREALREVLDHLAPDESVTNQQGFQLEPNSNGPTMKQKMRFILKQRGMSSNAIQPSENAATAVDEILATFVRSIYTRSNISTHTPTEKREVQRIRDLVRVALTELLSITAKN